MSVKEHFKKHKVAYIIGGAVICVGVGAGITRLIMRDKTSLIKDGKLALRSPSIDENSVPLGNIEGANSVPLGNTAFNFSGGVNNGFIDNSVKVYEREGRGHPGYQIWCQEDKTLYDSQKRAAFEHDITEDRLSKYLTGKSDNAGGHHFDRVNAA